VLWIRVIAILVDKLAPTIAFSFLDTKLYRSMSKDAFTLPSHQTKGALVNIPMVAESSAKLGIVGTGQDIVVPLTKTQICLSNPLIIQLQPTSTSQGLCSSASFPYNDIICYSVTRGSCWFFD
jgi:hypothetical protein